MWQILIYVVVAIACLLVGREVGKLLFKTKKDLTGLRKAAQSLAIALREHGLRRLPEVLEAFTVGEVDDLLQNIREFAIVAKSGNEAILKELDGTFERCLGVKLSTPEGRAVIAARLAEAAALAAKVAVVAAVV